MGSGGFSQTYRALSNWPIQPLVLCGRASQACCKGRGNDENKATVGSRYPSHFTITRRAPPASLDGISCKIEPMRYFPFSLSASASVLRISLSSGSSSLSATPPSLMDLEGEYPEAAAVPSLASLASLAFLASLAVVFLKPVGGVAFEGPPNEPGVGAGAHGAGARGCGPHCPPVSRDSRDEPTLVVNTDQSFPPFFSLFLS